MVGKEREKTEEEIAQQLGVSVKDLRDSNARLITAFDVGSPIQVQKGGDAQPVLIAVTDDGSTVLSVAETSLENVVKILKK